MAIGLYHPCTNGDIERANHKTVRMLTMVADKQQTDWDVQLPHVELAYNNCQRLQGLPSTKYTRAAFLV